LGRPRKRTSNYHFTKSTRGDLNSIVERVVEALKQKRFGIPTDEGLTLENKIGVVLPCNVIVRKGDGGAEVAAIDPRTPMQQVANPALDALTVEVAARLGKVLASI
jgi:uncharacterized protein (DUF302 family)